MKSRLCFLSVSRSPSHTQALFLSLSRSVSLSRAGTHSLAKSAGVYRRRCQVSLFWMVEFTQKERKKKRKKK